MGEAVGQVRKDADKLVTDYFAGLLGHLNYTLREKLGDGVVKSTPFEFVVTVPAIWSDLAKDKTRQACARGIQRVMPGKGLAPVHLISEPEAAAIYAIHGLDPHGLKTGDSFVICDVSVLLLNLSLANRICSQSCIN
jgi:hypothetical protein